MLMYVFDLAACYLNLKLPNVRVILLYGTL